MTITLDLAPDLEVLLRRFAGRVGLVSGSGESSSENGGRRFAAHLERKHRKS